MITMKEIKVIYGQEEVYKHFLDYVSYGLELVAADYGFTVRKEVNEDLKCSILIDNRLVGFLVYGDNADYDEPGNSYFTNFIEKYEPSIIFKYQFDSKVDYKYPNTIPSGFFSKMLWINHFQGREAGYEYIETDRTIDINARMMDWSSKGNSKHNWVRERKSIIEVAKKIASEGEYNVVFDKRRACNYFRELSLTKIGFNWRGWALLNFRIYEYLYYGVAMITDPLDDYPLREDIQLEHGVTAIFSEAKDFEREAKALLKDPQKIKTIGANGRALFMEYLSPERVGEWYYRKLKEYDDGF